MIITSYSFSEASSFTQTWLDKLRCRGTESRLINCPANTIGVEDCTHSEDVALSCAASTASKSSMNADMYSVCTCILLASILNNYSINELCCL